MRKFGVWMFDTLCGIFLFEGLLAVIWLISYLICRKPEVNVANLIFLTEVIVLFWVTGFIFHFSSPAPVKGILHGILCFMLSIIIFSLNYGYVPGATQLITIMVAFFAIYGALLAVVVYVSKKLNVPFRYFTAWLFKLNSKQTRKISDEK